MGFPTWLVDGLTTAATAAGAIGVLAGATWGTYSKAVVPFRRFAARASAVLDDHESIKRDISTIRSEVTHNGGGSLKDAVRRTEKSVMTIAAVQKAQITAEQDPGFYCDAKGETTSVTAGYTRLTGLDLNGAQREGWKRSIHPDDLDEVLSKWHEAIRTETVFVAEYRYVNITYRSKTACRVTAEPIVVDGVLHGFAGRVEILAGLEADPIDPEAHKAYQEILRKQ